MARSYHWKFPLPRTHTGILLGNATMGLMVWGEGRTLRLTIGRADFWDHRGGLPWDERQSYARIRACLEAGDETSLKALFEQPGQNPGGPRRPSVLPIGRLDLDLGPGVRLLAGTLDLEEGCLSLTVRKEGRERSLSLFLAMDRPLLLVQFPPGLSPSAVQNVPAWEYVGDYLESISFKPPQDFSAGEVCGWTQTRPADPALCVAWRLRRRLLALTTQYGATPELGIEAGSQALAALDPVALRAACRHWWRHFWNRVPAVDLPNPDLQFLYEYGMYKFAGLTQPAGPAATLQGPWVEEYQMPPWSNDYHFNINVQMCYWPAFHGNCLEHLRPLWDMIASWMPILRHNAKVFLGIDDGLMLPHAVDDRGTCMGGFWTGNIDHGCTAWVAQMMFRYYRYTGDLQFLDKMAYPFMAGAMRVYQAMLERQAGRLRLPVSVSPEYRGAALDAWGANASFQLACLHRLCEDLLEASAILHRSPDPAWLEISRDLPRACLAGGSGNEEIALWEGLLLEGSHRHHSHLAGLVPFDVIDLDDQEWRGILQRSLRRWVGMGAGHWSGWCIPWASMLCSRIGEGPAAELWLDLWQRVYTNEGHGTLHDAHFPGFTLIGRSPMGNDGRPREIMQIEAGMGAVAAIQEMLLHVRRGVTYLFRGAPPDWTEVGFTGMLTEGGFLVSARRRAGKVDPVTVMSQGAGILRLANPWEKLAEVEHASGAIEVVHGPILEIHLPAHSTMVIRKA